MKTMRQTTMIRCPVLLTVLVALLGWGSAVQAGTNNCGIAGQTFVHDSRVFNPFTGQVGSTGPFQASLRVYSVRPDRLVTTVVTDAEGRFQVALRPGTYRVVPDTMWQGRVLGPDE